MSQATRPRRSLLYMPATNERAMEKSRQLPVDGVILDLEDAVAPAEKPRARNAMVDALRRGGFGHREVIVRVNGLDTPWGQEDLHTVASLPVDGVLIPKVRSSSDVITARTHLCQSGGGADLPLWLMGETVEFVLGGAAILAADEALGAVVAGVNDLAKTMRVPLSENRLGLLPALSYCVLAARQAGIDIIDGVYLDLTNEKGLRAECQQGRELGFDGKSLIHPAQVEITNTIFGVTEEDAARAREIIDAWSKAEAQGQGVVVVRGQMVEQLHVDEAHRLLALHEASSGDQE